MKHNLLKSVIISVILLMGVSNAWAYNFKNPHIYFNNTSLKLNPAMLLVGHNNYSIGYNQTSNPIDNTNLVYFHPSANWGDQDGFTIGQGSDWGGDNTQSFTKRSAYLTNHIGLKYSYNFDEGKTYYVTGTAGNNPTISVDYKSDGYSGIPKYNATQAAKLRNDISSSYTTVKGTWPTTLKLKGTYLSGDGASARTEISGTASGNAESNRVYGAVVTGKITHTYSTITGNYIFEGWGTGSAPSTTNDSYEYNITADKIVYAFFTKAYTVTFDKKGTFGSSTVSATATANSTTKAISSGTKVAAGSTIELTATPASGYRVVGWYSDANCTNLLQNGGNTYDAGTLTAEKTVYVKFEETKYDVTIQAGANGSVSPSGVKKVGITPVNITATANNGYTFKNWTKIGNVTITDTKSASTTITATGTGTVTANFETAKRIYLKPAGDNDWANGNPRYAVYVIDDQTWHNMTKINDNDGNTDNDIYYCDIKSTDQKVIFCRMDPNAAANNWGNRWTQTENLTLPDNCNLFDIAKDANTANNVNATGTWMEYNAWHITGAFNEWALCGQTFKEQEDGSFTFTQHLELGTYEFKLVHNGDWYGNNGTMVRSTSTGWTMSTSANNCKITADYAGNYTFMFDASTKKLTVQYPILVKLVRSEFGPYGISYNGQSYFSKDDDDVIVNVPYGATITFIEGQPYSDIYTGGIMQSAPTKVPQLDLNQPFTVLSDVTFDDNYVTKVPQVAYLGVPNSLSGWAATDTRAQYIWRFDSQGGFIMEEVADRGTLEFEVDGIKYYKYTIQEGCNKFQFQHKTKSNTQYNQEQTHYQTDFHLYEVLTTDVNCYMLDGTSSGITYGGYWCALPPREGDYRLLYVEQVVEKSIVNGDEWKTVITRKKAHPSDIIKKRRTESGVDTVSLHVYNDNTYQAVKNPKATNDKDKYYTSPSNSAVILQQYDGSKWVDIQHHMVFGPLEAHQYTAMLPGRRNATAEDEPLVAQLKADDGIENIKNDDHPDQGNGVWNFVVEQDGEGNASVRWDQTHRYTGEYYIRTNAAFGEWNSYKGSDNHMTRSDVSKQHSNYSHYYCKWIDQVGTNVTYTIANDYGMAISDTLTADETDIWGTLIADAQKIVTSETLPTNNEYGGANIRFSWNEKSNFLHRAYLAGSTYVASRFLVLEGKSDKLYDAEGNALAAGVDNGTDPRYGLNANEEIFNDISNWVYYADVQLVPNADLKLTAKYMDKIQYFVGQESNYNNTILKGEGSDKYLIRLLYDFKTNELISAYVPGGQAGKEIEAIETNLMLLRKENETPRQLSFNTNNMKDVGQQAYGVLELTQATLEDNTKNVYVRSLYWISFPFDVRITDIFGFGEYGKHWIIQSYDGAKRAANGLWADSETNWVYHFDPNTLNAGTPDAGIMKKGVGYVVALNLKNIQAESPFVGRIKTLALYFPSTTTITGHIVNENAVSISVPEHKCTINRPTLDGDRRIKDSHWNVIGVPSYINAVGDFTGKINTIAEDVKFYYRWLGDYDKYEVVSGKSGVSFNSLNAYMVQFAGNLQWTNVLNEEAPAGMAAKRNSDNMQEHHLCLELQQNGNEQDRTFIQLQEDEVTTAFDFNYDLCKIINKGANIYSLIATDRDPIEVAGNVLPVEEAIIPLGIQLDAAGEYTFAMPEGTDGIVVELIDYENNTRTNMLLDSYTVNLEKGTFDNRFALHVKPSKVATSVDNIGDEATGEKTGLRKFIIDGILYMQKDGVLYDAQGKLVR